MCVKVSLSWHKISRGENNLFYSQMVEVCNSGSGETGGCAVQYHVSVSHTWSWESILDIDIAPVKKQNYWWLHDFCLVYGINIFNPFSTECH
jgi:hypothetical protein